MPGTDLPRPLASRSSFSCHPRQRERSPRQSASQNGRWWRVDLGTLQESRRPGWHWSPTGRLYEETLQYKQWYLIDQGKFVLLSCTRSRHRLLPRVWCCGATAESLVPELSQTSQNARMSGFFPLFFFFHYPLNRPTVVRSRVNLVCCLWQLVCFYGQTEGTSERLTTPVVMKKFDGSPAKTHQNFQLCSA